MWLVNLALRNPYTVYVGMLLTVGGVAWKKRVMSACAGGRPLTSV